MKRSDTEECGSGIPKEIIRSGSVIIFNDAKDSEDMLALAREIEDYNAAARVSKKKMRLLEEIKYGHILLNLVVPWSFINSNREMFFAVVPVAVLVLSILLFVFALFKKKLWLIKAAALLFAVLDWRFVFLFASDTFLDLLIWRIESPLKDRLGYPLFYEISVKYDDRCNYRSRHDR